MKDTPTLEILLLSDNHAFIDDHILRHAEEVDEVWHAGDWLSVDSADQLLDIKPVRAVYGNVDGDKLRKMFPETLVFEVEGIKVLMRHIAGYPGRYNQITRDLIRKHRPNLVICGHSHILKIVRDPVDGHLHMNPGACGLKGFHQVRTMIRFTIASGKISSVRVIELKK